MTKRTPKPPVAPDATPALDPNAVYTALTPDYVRPRKSHDALDLRARCAAAVHEFTTLKRAEQIRKGVPVDKALDVTEEYDPVVEMALIAGDKSNTQELRLMANAQVARYLRPPMKAQEAPNDVAAAATEGRKREISQSLFAALNDIAKKRRIDYEEKQKQEVTLT